MDEKQKLRVEMRDLRRRHVAALPDSTRALLFLRPPRPLADLAPEGSLVGLYHANANEAPTRGYAKWFYENGRHIALPRFTARGDAMAFHRWHDPFEDSDLEQGPYGHLQPAAEAEAVVPGLVIVPLLAFTAEGGRLGQGGGHYDRWLAAHPDTLAVGIGWDDQRVDHLPIEDHDRTLNAVVTPTRLYERES
ncbi:5-formyltetrahydrofolate cyclo-ligase [Novosphingobium sp. JCM 18896]|uniref:5-formyltetrahydrofolate cyclo-ligase n=1 Tax=Novosphingobium sp. JCM 18896 TaxID=2989731 RepID=UPI0022221E48|nr:5-formyltetrahydrofolate cyclo-ligase [Novosphingobium sp. JCM 18896]MCW1431131.1 5-formyltetrahydrofolate cyclo-ligase [Novosphingobium sp. JCM 18896]